MVTFVIMRILVVRTFRLSSSISLGKVSYFRISSSKRAPEVPTTMDRSDKTYRLKEWLSDLWWSPFASRSSNWHIRDEVDRSAITSKSTLSNCRSLCDFNSAGNVSRKSLWHHTTIFFDALSYAMPYPRKHPCGIDCQRAGESTIGSSDGERTGRQMPPGIRDMSSILSEY